MIGSEGAKSADSCGIGKALCSSDAGGEEGGRFSAVTESVAGSPMGASGSSDTGLVGVVVDNILSVWGVEVSASVILDSAGGVSVTSVACGERM